MRYETKRLIVYSLFPFVWPLGLMSWLPYKLFRSEVAFDFFSKLLSLIPGKLGQYTRTAYYKMTLTECHYDLMVGFCSFFSHPTARVGRKVGMGSFSIVGACNIGDNVMISSRVSVSGQKHLHGNTMPADASLRKVQDEAIMIGDGCWIGEGAVVQASLGRQCVVSAGSVVVNPSQDHVVAIGNPARFLKIAEDSHNAV